MTWYALGIRALQLTNTYQVILIDKNDYHTYTPLLYEAATTSKETINTCGLKDIVTFPLELLIAPYPIRFIKDSLEKLDLTNGNIHCTHGNEFRFEYLVLALGCETNYYHIPGLETYALPLKTFIDAVKIRDRILTILSDEVLSLNIVIGGGGATGIELGGEIASWMNELRDTFPRLAYRIKIVEASPSILF